MINSTDVLLALRREQIAVLHVVRPTLTPSGRWLFVVFLESTHGQADAAQECVRRLPDIDTVSFASHTRAIMYVFLRPERHLLA